VQWVVVVTLWLLIAVRLAVLRHRGRRDRRLLTALETLRGWGAPAGTTPGGVRVPQQRTGSHDTQTHVAVR
jgi:hypothetical protein